MDEDYQEIEVPGIGLVEFPASMSDADILTHVQRLSQEADTNRESPGALTRLTQSLQTGEFLPTAGALVGGVVGGIGGTVGGLGVGGVPGAIGGAALGGAAGEATRQLYRRATGQSAPGSPMDAAKTIGVVAGREGALQAAGGAIGKGLSAAGWGLYRGGVALLPKALKQEFPDLAEAGLREGVSLTRRGVEKAGRLAGESAEAADALIARGTAGTAQVLGPSNAGRVPGFVALPEVLEDVPDMMRAAGRGALGACAGD